MMLVMLMMLPLLCVGLSSMLLGLSLLLLLGTCTGSGFLIGLASLFSVLVMLVCSCIWRLFGLTLVISVGGGNAAAIGKGRGGVSS